MNHLDYLSKVMSLGFETGRKTAQSQEDPQAKIRRLERECDRLKSERDALDDLFDFLMTKHKLPNYAKCSECGSWEEDIEGEVGSEVWEQWQCPGCKESERIDQEWEAGRDRALYGPPGEGDE